MIVSGHIPGMYDGVSQQAPVDRYPRQCEGQINVLNRIADGAAKRPPAEHVKKVSSTPFGRAFFHTINRDTSERYTVVVTDGDLQVYDAQSGEAKVVGFPDGKGYLSVADPKLDFSMVSVADYTFIVNKRITVDVDTGKLTPGGGISATEQEWVDVLNRDGDATGDIIRIEGGQNNNFDQWYVENLGSTWTEVARPGIVSGFDHTTMPHALVRNSDGTFTFKELDWAELAAGDATTNPRPSFVGRKISDIYFFRNRLGIIAGDSVVMSRAGGYFNFWRETATDLLDTDPIDIAVTGTSVANLHHAVPFNETLMLFGGQQQYVLQGGQVLRPQTVSADPATAFEVDPAVRPVGIGPSVYFSVPAGAYSSIREYYVQEDSVANDATDVTSHVPRLLPSDLSSMSAATNEDMLFVQGESEPGVVYVYRMYWSNGKKAQSAWGKWKFPGTVLNAAVIENRLMLLLERTDGVHLCRVDLRSGQMSGDLDFNVLVDMRVAIAGTYEASPDETRFELPYDVETDEDAVLILDDGAGAEAGQELTPRKLAANLYAVDGDYQGITGFLGVGYRQSYTFTKFYYRSSDNAVTTSRLQLRRLWLTIRETGFFEVHMRRNGIASKSVTVAPGFGTGATARIVGSSSWELGRPVLGDGQVSLPVRGNNEHLEVELINDSPYPSNFISAEWLAEFNPDHRL